MDFFSYICIDVIVFDVIVINLRINKLLQKWAKRYMMFLSVTAGMEDMIRPNICVIYLCRMAIQCVLTQKLYTFSDGY